jgi:hypothetical protein
MFQIWTDSIAPALIQRNKAGYRGSFPRHKSLDDEDDKEKPKSSVDRSAKLR